MDTVRIGIIGAGVIANHHADGYAHSGKARIVAAADVNEDTLNVFCDKNDVAWRFTDYRDLLALDDVDAVSVCLPPFLHAPASVDALRAGKHVLCEKPMCCTVEEAESMVSAAKEADRLLQVYYRYRFSNAARKAREIVAGGALGRIYLAKATGYRFRGRPIIDPGRAGEWFMDPEKAGAGVLFDLAGYTLDLVFWLLGFPKVKRVTCNIYQEIDAARAREINYRVDDHAVGMLTLEDGATVWIELAKAANMDPSETGGTRLFGSEAGLTLRGPTLYRANAAGEMETVVYETPPDVERSAHRLPPTQFVESILEDKPVTDCSGEEGLFVQRLLNAMLQSAQEGREITLGAWSAGRPSLPC